MTHDPETPDPSLDDSLAGLPALADPSAEVPRAERAAAMAAFEAAHGRGGPTFGLSLSRVAVPLGLAAVVVVYLSWAVSAASALQQ